MTTYEKLLKQYILELTLRGYRGFDQPIEKPKINLVVSES